jgi:hypothetical protein
MYTKQTYVCKRVFWYIPFTLEIAEENFSVILICFFALEKAANQSKMGYNNII